MVTTELTVGERGRRIRLLRELGRGATSAVWLGLREGVEVAVKIGRSAAQRPRFADEAARLAGVGGARVSPLVDADVAGETVELPDGSRVEAGAPIIVLGSAQGATLDVLVERARADADELALVIARDIGRALAELHASGAAHGDVKPENVVVETGASGKPERATLVDFGLATEASEVTPRGGTRRYLAPEAFDGGGDARLRDLWALGVVLAEILVPEIARSERIAPTLSSSFAERLAGEAGRLARALLSGAPAARPSATWIAARAELASGATETPEAARARREAAVRRAYLAVRREEIAELGRFEHVDMNVGGEPAVWLAEALELARAVGALRGEERRVGRGRVESLGEHDLARFLVTLVGPAAAAWPRAPFRKDDELVRKLVALVAEAEPESLTWLHLTESAPLPRAYEDVSGVDLALALERGLADPLLFDQIEARLEARSVPEALRLSLVRALTRRGQLGRALAVAASSNEADARAESAEVSRRAGDATAAETLARALVDGGAR
ncbi:MAG TPA: protein kinase, partial [Polyangiaceae bacterium]